MASTTRAFSYLEFVLYVCRVTPNHILLSTDDVRHAELWKKAKRKRFPAPKSKALVDKKKRAYIASIRAYSDTPRRSTTTTRRTATAPASRTTRKQRLTDAQMVGAPQSVTKAYAGKCMKCGGAHLSAECPIAKKDPSQRSQAETKLLAKHKTLQQQLRRARSAFMAQQRGLQ